MPRVAETTPIRSKVHSATAFVFPPLLIPPSLGRFAGRPRLRSPPLKASPYASILLFLPNHTITERKATEKESTTVMFLENRPCVSTTFCARRKPAPSPRRKPLSIKGFLPGCYIRITLHGHNVCSKLRNRRLFWARQRESTWAAPCFPS